MTSFPFLPITTQSLTGEGFVVSSVERLRWPPAQRASGSERGGHGMIPLTPALSSACGRHPYPDLLGNDSFLERKGLKN